MLNSSLEGRTGILERKIPPSPQLPLLQSAKPSHATTPMSKGLTGSTSSTLTIRSRISLTYICKYDSIKADFNPLSQILHQNQLCRLKFNTTTNRQIKGK